MNELLKKEKPLPSKTSSIEKDPAMKVMPWMLISAGLFSWAVRGSAGYGAIRGCIFAGLLWGITWYFLSKEKGSVKNRRYGMGWTVFALTFGIGISGLQGWGDIVALVRGTLVYQTEPRLFLPISQIPGFVYMFFLGFHWIGTGVVLLSWAGSKSPATWKTWMGRIGSIAGGALIGIALLYLLPQLFLPEYATLDNWDYTQYPKLEDLHGEIFQCILFSGATIGGLVHEIARKDWLNVKLILYPSVFVGLSWMLLITIWELWVTPAASDAGITFNWWRCWESTGGGAMGAGLSIAFWICNKKLPENHEDQRKQPYSMYPNGERLFGVYFSIAAALAYSTYQGILGWNVIAFNDSLSGSYPVYIGYLMPILLLCFLPFIWTCVRTIQTPSEPLDNKDVTPEFIPIYFITFIILRELGLQVTWATTFNFSEIAFFVYYIVLAVVDICIAVWLVQRQKNR